eukprot:gb/GECH01010658.1/.p1 GENE.gb/GECH01010658.1/~~gb/GECH01010658.1/.p1  ORF type:complete len:783 (+),score=196.99 gb/GECH01010658.1/:1-2349(+)
MPFPLRVRHNCIHEPQQQKLFPPINTQFKYSNFSSFQHVNNIRSNSFSINRFYSSTNQTNSRINLQTKRTTNFQHKPIHCLTFSTRFYSTQETENISNETETQNQDDNNSSKKSLSKLTQEFKSIEDTLMGGIFLIQDGQPEGPSILDKGLNSGMKTVQNLESHLFDELAETQEFRRMMDALTVAHMTQGNLCLQKGKYKEATSHFAQATQTKPQFADAYLQLAELCQMQKDHFDALSYYNQAIEILSQKLEPVFKEAKDKHISLEKACHKAEQLSNAWELFTAYSERAAVYRFLQTDSNRTRRWNRETAREAAAEGLKLAYLLYPPLRDNPIAVLPHGRLLEGVRTLYASLAVTTEDFVSEESDRWFWRLLRMMDESQVHIALNTWGASLLRRSEYDSAAERIRASLDKNNDYIENVEAYKLLGETYCKLERYNDCINLLSPASEHLDQQLKEYTKQIRTALENFHRKRVRFDQVYEAWEKLHDLYRDTIHTHGVLGDAYYYLNKTQEMVHQLGEADRLCYAALKAHGAVSSSVPETQAIVLSTPSKLSIENLITLMNGRFKLDQIQEAFTTADIILNELDQLPAPHSKEEEELRLMHHADCLVVKSAAIFRIEQNYEQALVWCSAAIELAPWKKSGYIQRSIIYQAQGRHEDALEDANQALSISEDYMGLLSSGAALESLGQKSEAYKAFKKAADRNPKSTAALYGTIRLAVELGFHDQALTTANQFALIEPENDEAQALLGSLLANKDSRKARKHLRRALDLNKQNETAQEMLDDMNLK